MRYFVFLFFFVPLSSFAQSLGSACRAAPTLPVTGTRIVNVSTEAALQQAVTSAQSGDTIIIANGTYNLSNTLYISGRSNITIRGNSGCDGVVLVGRGMDNSNSGSVPHGVWSNSATTTIAHLTIRNTWDNLIIFNAGASAPRIYNVKLLDSGSQFIKSNPDGSGGGVNNGLVEYSVFEYTAGPPSVDHGSGVGYFNGLSIHTAANWVIRDNLFKNLHNPDTSAYLWNPAILVWNHSTGTTSERNVFLNIDRAIAYGLGDVAGTDHQGGVIRNNFITQTPGFFSAGRKAGSDGLIIVWDSPATLVYHNTVLSNGNSARSIEFRFATTGAEAKNNLSDTPLGTRDGATFSQSGNLTNATPSFFSAPLSGDLHLISTATSAIDQAPNLPSVTNDIDGNARPSGAGYDVGADEFTLGGDTVPPAAPTNLH